VLAALDGPAAVVVVEEGPVGSEEADWDQLAKPVAKAEEASLKPPLTIAEVLGNAVLAAAMIPQLPTY